ncbi:incA domain-containing protein [Rutstroemia sp. NJR-2017a WRK4]|nr:incA domain-containing protein [Rutstroemia sp. NJR-2017a WRK4]
MDGSRENAQSLDRRVHEATLGVALVRLKNLKYESPPGRPSIPLQPKKFNHWVREFSLEGCIPSIPRNRIRAKISQSILNDALSLSGITIDDLKDGEALQHLELPEGILLAYNHGQHRLEAAKRHVYPHNVWWAVELLEDSSSQFSDFADETDALGPGFAIQEQDRNIESFPHDDGTVFRLIEAERAWARAWCSKQAEVDLKAIEKRPALYAAFSALRPFIGLWQSFQKGTLHRFNRLKCDHGHQLMTQELIHYLHHIKNTWITIIGGDYNLAEGIDANTVELLEARAPVKSTADKEYILEQFENYSVFPCVYDEVARARLQQNVLSIDGMIPSIRTFTEDTLWLEDSLAAVKKLIDPGKFQLRDALRYAWRGLERNSVVLEYADGLTKKVSATIDEESQFEVASAQLWMFAMRNYPRLTSLCPKTDGKYKVAVVGPDPKCLQEFARTAADLGFESTLIDALLKRDPTRIYIREMLTKARSREEFDYDIERQEQAHYELLQQLHSLEARPGQSPPVWTTTTTDVKVDRRYGRPYDGALKECAPYFFLLYICQDPECGRFMTNLFVKRGTAQVFFHMPHLRLEHMLQRGVEGAAARAPVEPVFTQVDNLAQARETIEELRKDNANQATSHAAIVSKLEEAQRQIAEQQKENSTNLSRLSESDEISARQVEGIREYQKKIAEIETANRIRTCEESRERLETANQLHERQIKIDSLIADREELLNSSRSEVALFERKIAEYKSQYRRQQLDLQELAAQTQVATTEKQELQRILDEWESGNRQVGIDADMTGDEPSPQEPQTLIKELNSTNQQQAEDLIYVRSESALKSEGLEIIHAKIRGLREGVEKLTECFVTRQRLEPGYEGGDCETIYSEDELPSAGDLATTGKYFDEIVALEKSIFAFIALYGRDDVLHPTSSIDILEWQKNISKPQLTISNEVIDELETNNPIMDGMLSMVKRRAGIIEQEARNMHDLQSKLEAASVTIDDQRHRLEALDEELEKARNQATTLQEEYQKATSTLQESLKVAQDDNEAMRKDVEGTGNLKVELSTAKTENEVLRKREAELDKQMRGNAEVWRAEEVRIQDLAQNLNEEKLALQKELDEVKGWSGSYIQDLKTARDTSKGRVIGLEKDLQTAQLSAKTMEKELKDLKAVVYGDLKAEVYGGDERVRRLKAQLLEVYRLIDLEKEKLGYETKLKSVQAAVAQAKADALLAEDQGDLMWRESALRADISRVDDGIVQTRLEVLKCSSHKVRFERARIGYQTGVDHVVMEDLENMLDKLHNKVVYCFVHSALTLVEPMKFKEFLANPKQLADDGEFFYCNPGDQDYTRKRRRRSSS